MKSFFIKTCFFITSILVKKQRAFPCSTKGDPHILVKGGVMLIGFEHLFLGKGGGGVGLFLLSKLQMVTSSSDMASQSEHVWISYSENLYLEFEENLQISDIKQLHLMHVSFFKA